MAYMKDLENKVLAMIAEEEFMDGKIKIDEHAIRDAILKNDTQGKLDANQVQEIMNKISATVEKRKNEDGRKRR